MATPRRLVIGTFALSGLASGVLVIPAAFLWLPLVFVCEGVLFALGFAGAYFACRPWLPRIGVSRMSCALGTFAVAYPGSIVFGGALSLASQYLVQSLFGFHEFGEDGAPLMIMAFLLLWGALACALFANMGLTVLTGEWDNRVFLMLAVGAVAVAAVSFGCYLPAYNSELPLVVRYRELTLFSVLAPVGNAVLAGICAYGLLRAIPREAIVLGTAAGRQQWER